jgi:hypothetical protein
MATSKLEKPAWHPYFDTMSKILEGKRAEIEVDSLDIGDQLQTDWIPLEGIVYDHKDDLIEVIVEGLDHLIHKPREVYVNYDLGLLSSIEIIDQDNVKQIVKLRDPLMLPAPASS